MTTIYRTAEAIGPDIAGVAATGITVVLTAYSDGDVVGGLLTFDIGDASGGGIVNQIRMVDEDSQPEPYDLYFFNAKPTVILDDAVFATAMTVADERKLIKKVSILAADYVTLNGFDYIHKELTQPLIFNGNGMLWAYLVASGLTPDYANVDTLWIGLDVVQG